MISLNTHTATGKERSYIHKYRVHYNEDNFFKFLDYYNALDDNSKRDKFNKLFGCEDLNHLSHFSYEENNYGFRSPNMFSYSSQHRTMWVFGDSVSYGHGVEYDKTWASLIAERYGYELYNFSVCGRGIDTAIRIAEQWTNNSNSIPGLIVTYGFYPSRHEYSYVYQDPINKSHPLTLYEAENIPLSDESQQLYQHKVDYLNSIFESYGVRYFNIDFLSDKDSWHNFYVDFGRDLSDEILDVLLTTKAEDSLETSDFTQEVIPHPGIQSHKNIYNHIKKIIDRG